MTMEEKVKAIILKALQEHYGENNVEENDGNVYVFNEDGACEITIRYEE